MIQILILSYYIFQKCVSLKNSIIILFRIWIFFKLGKHLKIVLCILMLCSSLIMITIIILILVSLCAFGIRYNESAIYYAQTQNSFEEICLKYLELGDMTALRKFLTYKLNSLDSDKVNIYICIFRTIFFHLVCWSWFWYQANVYGIFCSVNWSRFSIFFVCYLDFQSFSSNSSLLHLLEGISFRFNKQNSFCFLFDK